jgi:DNA replication protein DnaC
MAKRKAAPKDDAAQREAPARAPADSVYIGQSEKPDFKPEFIYLRLANRHGLITGATGTGKTYVACALAQQACRKGFRAIYRRAPRLFDELRLAHADGSYVRLLERFARADVLVIDDFAIAPVTDVERRDLLELLEDRYGSRSTIVTSQLAPSDWHDYLADPTLADAICDRVVHHAHRLVLKGPSRRKEKPAEKK